MSAMFQPLIGNLGTPLGGTGDTITIATYTPASTSYYGASTNTDLGGTFGSFSNTSVGGGTLESVYAYSYAVKGTTFYDVIIEFTGDETSSASWTDITFDDSGTTPTLTEASVTPAYDAGLNRTKWLYTTTVTGGAIYESYQELTGNSGSTRNITWT